ncbi:hypothetical protein F5Y08DRAFT_341188 [Xylaria arbuscula]|uniref:Infection structure specific protein n=1 Tax=Xylaria arbuscula TaxID=114810 RepID=A0A9W8TSL6_9PEZI|nr:hypothetical protein F5Y08DRAFT_341188 [Xylaria arbuscula]KAJ3580511.1 hypothetical protein NPX13_g60 [Xylaria arbuscula]
MYGSKFILSVTALAGTSLAQTTTSKSPECQSSLEAFSDVPVPSAALASYLASSGGSSDGSTGGLDATFEDPDGYQAVVCSVAATLPKSLIPDFQAFGSSLLSYGSVHLSQYDAYVTNCIASGDAASTITSQLHEMLTGTGGMCQQTATATTTPVSNGTTYSTGTGAYTPGPTATSSDIPYAGAARPTGAIVGAAAIGGLLGVVALL